MENRTYYDILNVRNSASDNEIKNAFRKLIKTWHPDLHPGDEEAVIKTQEINEAYNVLSDREKRAEYDRKLNTPHTQSTTQSTTRSARPENKRYESRQYEAPKSEEPDKALSIWIKLIVMLPMVMLWASVSNRYHLIEEEQYRVHQVLLPILFLLVVGIGIFAEIKRRNDIAKKKRAENLGGIDSIIEVERWFDRFINSDIPLKECRNAFFKFSVRADQHLLLRFNSLSNETKKQYKDVIELLEYVIEFRERNA